MEIEVEKRVTTKERVTVEFPVFVEHDDSHETGGWETHYRLDANGTLWTVTRYYHWSRGEEQNKYEFECEKVDLPSTLGHWINEGSLGRITSKQFVDAVARAKAALEAFPIE